MNRIDHDGLQFVLDGVRVAQSTAVAAWVADPDALTPVAIEAVRAILDSIKEDGP